MNGLIGRKLGMTRLFDEEGTHVPVTVIEAGPCPVVQVMATAVQLGFGAKKPKRSPKALHRAGPQGREGGSRAEPVVRARRRPGTNERTPHRSQAGRTEPP